MYVLVSIVIILNNSSRLYISNNILILNELRSESRTLVKKYLVKYRTLSGGAECIWNMVYSESP